MTPDCPLIEIFGTPFARGAMYGKKARDRIVLGVAHYTRQLQQSAFGSAELGAVVRKLLPHIEAFDTHLVEEMRGIASGAEIAFEEIVLLNARTEILQLAAREAGKSGFDKEPDGCTGVVALPAATRTGRLIHAQNWDWKYECAETAIILRIRRDDGPDLLTFTEAGGLARCGMNAAGIAITGNYLECDRDYADLGVPLALIRRKALEQEQLALAIQAIYCTKKSASNNMIVSHAQGIAIDFECAPNESFQVHAKGGLLVHANHWQSSAALAKLQDTGVNRMPDSLYRDLRVRELLLPHIGEIGTDEVKAALFDKFGSPWSVCRPSRPSRSSSNLSATVAMIVMEPAIGRMEVAMLPAQNTGFLSFSLETQFASVPPYQHH